MGLNNPYISEHYVPAYQASASPWVTSSVVTLGGITELSFGNVTRFIYVKNTSPTTSDKIAIAFTRNGLLPSSSNFIPLSGSETFQAELRLSKLYISGAAGAGVGFTVLAGITNIPATDGRFFLTVTASNGFNAVG